MLICFLAGITLIFAASLACCRALRGFAERLENWLGVGRCISRAGHVGRDCGKRVVIAVEVVVTVTRVYRDENSRCWTDYLQLAADHGASLPAFMREQFRAVYRKLAGSFMRNEKARLGWPLRPASWSLHRSQCPANSSAERHLAWIVV